MQLDTGSPDTPTSSSVSFSSPAITSHFIAAAPLDYLAPVELHKDQQRIQSSCFHSSSRFLRLGFQLNVVFQIWQSVCTSAASLRDASCTVSAGKRSKAAQWSDIIHHLILESAIGDDLPALPKDRKQRSYHL